MRARALFAAACGLLLGYGATAAHAQTITVEDPGCLPREENGVVRVRVNGNGHGNGAAGQAGRLYFRWKDHKAFYWVPLEMEPDGRYWAVPPKPERRNESVELYAALVDGAGNVTARSEPRQVKVNGDCRVQLSAKERGVAENLTVGETAPDQQGKEVYAFLCDGVVTRVNSQGIRRSDEICRACVIAWWPRKSVLLPAAAVVGVIVSDDPEPSPSRPR
ncbi:MAG TPA: hypothetical protein VEL74_09055 [Thermoanaerobaculia bacterium]|nr:hypothetical protein [Thermoanaerobaculia bacterium]